MKKITYEVQLINGSVITGLSYDESMKYFYSHAGSVVRPEDSARARACSQATSSTD